MTPAWTSVLRRIALATLLVTTSQARPAPPIPPETQALLDRIRTLAGAPAWRRVGIVRIEGRVAASGLEGDRVTIADAATGRFDVRDRFPIFGQREVWDGRTGWRQGNSGGVHRLDGAFAMKRHATDAWLVRRGWLLPDAGGAYVGPPVTHTVAGHDLAVVTALPTDGQPVTLVFDPATGDLVRAERAMPISLQRIRYGDYRVVEGTRLPFAIEVDENGEDVEALRIARYDLHATASGDAFREPVAPTDWTMDAPSVAVPFDLRNGVLTIEAKLNGHGPYRFIFDTGGHAIVSPELATALQLDRFGAGQSGGAGEGTLSEQYARVARVEIGGLTLADQHFFVLPLGWPTLERGDEAPIGGLFGLELLERLAVRFDYPARTITFTPFAAHRTDPRAIVTPVRFDDDMPLVDARLDGHAGVFALDTGNSSSLVVQHLWAGRNGLADALQAGLETASFGAGGVSRNWIARIDRFEIAGQTLERPLARYAEDRRGAFSSRTEAGNVGTQVLANFVVDFDYRRGTVGWRRVPGYVAPPYNRGGFRAMKDRPEDFVVVVVAKASPAERAGVRARDRVVAIDGVGSASLSGADFNEVFAKPPGTVVRLDLMRADGPASATVTLDELLP